MLNLLNVKLFVEDLWTSLIHNSCSECTFLPFSTLKPFGLPTVLRGTGSFNTVNLSHHFVDILTPPGGKQTA